MGGQRTDGKRIEIWRRQMPGNCHAAAVGHVQSETPRVLGVNAGVEHLPGVVVEHHAAHAEEYFIFRARAQLADKPDKFLRR